VRRAVLLLLASGCVRTSPPAAPPAAAAAPLASGSVLSSSSPCAVRGAGDLNGTESFLLFTDAAGEAAPLSVDVSTAVAATWTLMPSGRARIEIGGQKRIRATLWASLEGRSFQLRRRALDPTGNAWIEPGVAVQVRGADVHGVHAWRPTELDEPNEVAVVAPCEALAYEPKSVGAARMPAGVVLEAAGDDLHLARTPGGPTLLVLRGIEPATIWVTDRRPLGSYVEVTNDGVGFAGWVPTSDLGELSPMRSACWGGMIGGGRGYVAHTRVRALRDAQIFVGSPPRAVAGAFVEEGAELRAYRKWGGFVQVTVLDDAVSAPDGLWIAAHDTR